VVNILETEVTIEVVVTRCTEPSLGQPMEGKKVYFGVKRRSDCLGIRGGARNRSVVVRLDCACFINIDHFLMPAAAQELMTY
jgi:hypothetical protein